MARLPVLGGNDPIQRSCFIALEWAFIKNFNTTFTLLNIALLCTFSFSGYFFDSLLVTNITCSSCTCVWLSLYRTCRVLIGVCSSKAVVWSVMISYIYLRCYLCTCISLTCIGSSCIMLLSVRASVYRVPSHVYW